LKATPNPNPFVLFACCFENCESVWKDATPKGVTPERFNRGASPHTPWIPAKNVRE